MFPYRMHRAASTSILICRSLLKAKAGSVAVTADDVVNSLLREVGVAAVSGTAFGDPSGIRLSYGIPTEMLETGLSVSLRCSTPGNDPILLLNFIKGCK